MIYLLNIEQKSNGQTYRMFETHTESLMIGNSNLVRKLVHLCKLTPINMTLTNKEITIKPWPHDMMEVPNMQFTYILLAKMDDQNFKMVNLNGDVYYVRAAELTNSIESNRVLNCSINKGNYKSIDTYEINADTRFKRHIDKKYTEFIAKALITGLDISFKYRIENKEVKITEYTGKSSTVITPNFITTICKEAFRHKNVREVKLNVGLKYIGETAFAANDINYVDIPETVEFIGYQAFEKSPGFSSTHRSYSKIINRLNDKTVLL